MSAAAAAIADGEPALACGNCGGAMRRLELAGHYGRHVEIDVCGPCHLVWFDQTEAARLSGPGLLDLIGAMARCESLPHEALRPTVACVRCRGPLKPVHNQSRWGRSLMLECRGHRHGAFQSFAQFLQEKGLLRPMSRLDRLTLLQRQSRLDCLNCGAGLGADDAECRWCRSVPALVDIPRLAHALDPEGAVAPQAMHGRAAQAATMQCAACGAALPAGQSVACAQCGGTLAVDRLSQVHAQLASLGPALRAHAAKPTPEALTRRLGVLDGDLKRRREWVAAMTPEDEWRTGRDAERHLLGSIELPAAWKLVRAVFIALAIWLAWRHW